MVGGGRSQGPDPAAQAELPGGTREPGESTERGISRELDEEIGGKLHHFRTVGMWRCTSSADRPRFSILVGMARLTHLTEPTGWGGNEDHQEIALVGLDEAVSRLAEGPDARPFSEVLDQVVRPRISRLDTS